VRDFAKPTLRVFRSKKIYMQSVQVKPTPALFIAKFRMLEQMIRQ
jgi:hypothetical protein